MFGIANQLLAVLALAIVSTWLVNAGRGRYLWVTVLPMLFVCSTTLTAGANLVGVRFPSMIELGRKKIEVGELTMGNQMILSGYLNIGMTLFVVLTVLSVVVLSAARWIMVFRGLSPQKNAA
jgi:carbon starvation protein